jgi:hypothetical protein
MRMRNSAVVAMCLCSGMVGGLAVSLLGAAPQPQPERTQADLAKRRADAAASIEQMERLNTTMLSTFNAEAAARSQIRAPVMMGAPDGGFVVVASASGGSYVIDGTGRAVKVWTVDGAGNRSSPDLWLGSSIKGDLFLPKVEPTP